MNLKIYLAILLTALNVCLYECEEDDNKRRCGEELSIFLAQTCHNTFAGVQVSKKSKYFPLLDFRQFSSNDIDNYDRALYPFSFKRSQNQLFSGAIQKRGGIVEECCSIKPCTLNEIQGYCGSK